MKEYLAI